MTSLALRISPAITAPIPIEYHASMLPAYFPHALRRASTPMKAGAGEQLFAAGETVQACYRVVKGRVMLMRTTADGGRIVLQQAADGDWLIEPGPFDKTVSCSAVADRPTTLRAVPMRAFRKVLQEDAAFANAWARETALTARRLQRTVERLTLSLASERILHYIATEADARTGELTLDFPLCEWARRLGMKGGNPVARAGRHGGGGQRAAHRPARLPPALGNL